MKNKNKLHFDGWASWVWAGKKIYQMKVRRGPISDPAGFIEVLGNITLEEQTRGEWVVWFQNEGRRSRLGLINGVSHAKRYGEQQLKQSFQNTGLS